MSRHVEIKDGDIPYKVTPITLDEFIADREREGHMFDHWWRVFWALLHNRPVMYRISMDRGTILKTPETVILSCTFIGSPPGRDNVRVVDDENAVIVCLMGDGKDDAA